MNDDTPKTRLWKRLLHRPGWLIALAVCLLLSAVLVPFGWRYYRTRQLVAGIEAHGGSVGFKQGGPQWLRSIVGGDWMTPLDVPNLIRPTLPELENYGPNALPFEKLNEDEFFAYVVPLNEMYGWKSIEIFADELSARSFEELSSFDDLEVLDIYGTSVTDDALRHLYGLKNLKSLVLTNTKVTIEGISELQRHLPHLSITNH